MYYSVLWPKSIEPGLMFRMFWLKPMDSPLNCAASLHLLPPPTPIFSFLNQLHLSYIITVQSLSLSPLQLVLYNLLGLSPLQDFRKAVLQKFFWVPQCLCFMPNYYALNSPWSREESYWNGTILWGVTDLTLAFLSFSLTLKMEDGAINTP